MSGKPVARVGDTGSHGGSIIDGSPAVRANNRPIALVGSTYNCPVHGPNPIVTGAPYILGNDVLVAHVGSKTACGAEITSGSPLMCLLKFMKIIKQHMKIMQLKNMTNKLLQ